MKKIVPFLLLISSISIVSALVLTGLGKLITTTSSPTDIASKSSNINDSHALITQVQWTRNLITNNIEGSTVSVKNSDTASHQFKICVLAKNPGAQSTNADLAANCGNTGSIASGSTGSASINFSNVLSSTDSTLITIQETS